MADKRVTRGIVLAAGDGGRLGELTSRIPKVLLRVLGKPLILYPIEALARAGIKEIAIVLGHLSDKVETTLRWNRISGVTLHYLLNPYYQGGNAVSVEVAGDWAGGEPFVLCMGDHIIHQDYISWFLSRAPCCEALGVDFSPRNHHILEEATKVQVDSRGLIRDIGKELTQWNGIDTGLFLMTESFVKAVRELRISFGSNIEISEVIRFMLRRGQDFAAVDISGPFWADIDTVEDMRMVESVER